MRLTPPLTRMDVYVLRELLVPFAIGVLVCLPMLVGHFLYTVMKVFVTRGLPKGAMMLYLLYEAPTAAVFAFGMATAFAVSLAANRLTRDGETVAFRVSGVSARRLQQPLLLFAAAASAAAYFVGAEFAPHMRHKAWGIVRELAYNDPVPLIEADQYFRVGDTYHFCVGEVDRKERVLRQVMIYRREPDRGGFPRLIVANEARKVPGGWRLYDCTTYKLTDTGAMPEEMPADTIDLPIKEDLEGMLGEMRTAAEMGVNELHSYLRMRERTGMRVHEDEVEYHRKFAIPVASFVFALIAGPLGMRWARAGGFVGLLLACLLIFFYQGFLSWTCALGVGGRLDPFWAAWFTNVLFAGFGAVLLLFER